jgi:hypothetical protein
MPMNVLAGEGSTDKTTIETLFDDKAQRTVIRRRTAIDRGLPSIRVAATWVEVPGFEAQICDRLFFIDAFRPKYKKPDVPISAWGVTAVAKNSPGAPELELLRARFNRPTKQFRRHSRSLQGSSSCSWAKTTPSGSPSTAETARREKTIFSS